MVINVQKYCEHPQMECPKAHKIQLKRYTKNYSEIYATNDSELQFMRNNIKTHQIKYRMEAYFTGLCKFPVLFFYIFC